MDFGTTNSTIGIFKADQLKMAKLDNHKTAIRSAMFFDQEDHRRLFGHSAVEEYLLGTQGRLIMSLKSLLGSAFMQEMTIINDKLVSYPDILGFFINHIKEKAEQELEAPLTHIVMGRPVRFHDENTEKDMLAQNTLEEIAKKQGFKAVEFLYEPIAAALSYENVTDKEMLAIVIDLGGGTSDFSVISMQGREANNKRHEVLANHGIHIGGNDFDALLNLKTVMPHLGLGSQMKGMSETLPVPNWFYYDLSFWHTINTLYKKEVVNGIKSIASRFCNPLAGKRLLKVVDEKKGHQILNEIESLKLLLSEETNAQLNLNFIEDKLQFSVARMDFEKIIFPQVNKITNAINETIMLSRIKHDAINLVFFTGGSAQIPLIQREIIQLFPTAQVVRGDAFCSVGKGLALEAKNRFG